MATEGSVVVTCGSCGTKLRTRAAAEGRTAKCPKCGTMLRIELPTAAAPVSPTPATTVETISPTAPAPQPPAPPAPSPAVAQEPAPSEPPAPSSVTPATTVKTAIVFVAVVLICGFVWYLAARFIGPQMWVVKFAIVAGFIGVLSGSAIASAADRRTLDVKAACVLASALSILLGKLLLVLLGAIPSEVAASHSLGQWIGLFLRSGWTAVDPLFFVIAIVGCAVWFILSE